MGPAGRGTAVAVVVALTVVSGVAAYKWWRPGHIVAEPPTNRAGVAIVEKSVAVLPFLDMSKKRIKDTLVTAFRRRYRRSSRRSRISK